MTEPTQEPDYAFLAELVFKSQCYPEWLQVTRGERDVKTGIYATVLNHQATMARIEMVMRRAEGYMSPLEAVMNSVPFNFKQTSKPCEYITEEQGLEIGKLILEHEKDLDQFCAYMGVEEIDLILEKDYAKAMNVFAAEKKK